MNGMKILFQGRCALYGDSITRSEKYIAEELRFLHVCCLYAFNA